MTRKIYVRNTQILLSKEYKHALAVRLVEEERSRKQTADHLMKILEKFGEGGGQVVIDKHYFMRLHSELVYDAFGEDMAFTWATDVKRYATKMPERRSSISQLLRYQIFDTVFRIEGDPIRLPTDSIFTPR